MSLRRTLEVSVPAVPTGPVEADALEAVVESQPPTPGLRSIWKIDLREPLEPSAEIRLRCTKNMTQASATCISGPKPTSSAQRFQTGTGRAPPLAWLCPSP